MYWLYLLTSSAVMCVRVCAYVRAHTYSHTRARTHTRTHVCICVYVYGFICTSWYCYTRANDVLKYFNIPLSYTSYFATSDHVNHDPSGTFKYLLIISPCKILCINIGSYIKKVGLIIINYIKYRLVNESWVSVVSLKLTNVWLCVSTSCCMTYD